MIYVNGVDERTGELGALRLKLVPLVPAVTMHDDSECGRGRLAGLARNDAVDVVRRRLAVVKDRLGGLVRRRHDLISRPDQVRSGQVRSAARNRNVTHVDVRPVDRERTCVLPDDHRHLSVHGVFLRRRELMTMIKLK